MSLIADIKASMSNVKDENKSKCAEDEVDEEIELGTDDTDTSGSGDESACESDYSFNSFLAKSDEEDNTIEEADESEDECSDESEDDAQVTSSSNIARRSLINLVREIDPPAKQDRLQAIIQKYEQMHALDDDPPKKRARVKK
jgi:hypothetical protein